MLVSDSLLSPAVSVCLGANAGALWPKDGEGCVPLREVAECAAGEEGLSAGEDDYACLWSSEGFTACPNSDGEACLSAVEATSHSGGDNDGGEHSSVTNEGSPVAQGCSLEVGN